MPTPQPAPFTTGSVITAATVALGVSNARAYLNGQIIDSDFEVEGIGYEDLARPVFLGYPFLVMDGEFQGSVFRTTGLQDNQAPQNQRSLAPANALLAREIERTSIFPITVDIDGRQVVRGSAARFDVDEAGTVDILFTTKLEAIIQPQGPAGTTYTGGKVKLFYRNTTTTPAGKGTDLPASLRSIVIENTVAGVTWFSFTGQFAVTPGVYDVWLAYVLGNADAKLVQIIASGPTLGVELHITG